VLRTKDDKNKKSRADKITKINLTMLANITSDLFLQIKNLIASSRQQVVRAVNSTMVLTYFQVGKIIVEDEQKGNSKAKYGERTLKELSTKLTTEFGKGFSVQNLENMRNFYRAFGISQTVSRKFTLSWSHYVFLSKIDEDERQFYTIEAVENNWSVRDLERQYNSSLFERLKLSKNKKKIRELSQKGQVVSDPIDVIKDPYILEFLNLAESPEYSESELEQEIINKIEKFLLEIGKGFTFVGRQQRFTFDQRHFYVDLVFYNRLLKCFVLLDLKIGELTHQDLGQMQMYVNYYDRFVKTDEESKTIGIVLCKDKNDSLVEITLPKENKQIFASKYRLYLPSKKELKKQMEVAL
jgi:predicted nuclease of restriction endonuclease-like (RecB) superfamily